MADIVGLVFPFFGMIFLGAFVARLTRQPVEALGWLNTFVVYVALPALFFQLIARTPVEELTEWAFILGVVLSTYLVFALMFAASVLLTGGLIGESMVRGLAAAYGNIGFMGPGIALLAFGEAAAVPVALIFCFENIMHFTLAPTLMALAGEEKGSRLQIAAKALKQVALHPFILATAAGVLAAYLQFHPPLPAERLLQYLAQAAAPCALFAMGVNLALRPLKRVPRDLGFIVLLKLIVHPVVCYLVLSAIGNFPPVWVYTAVMMAALPTATNVFVIAQQYGVWVERASASVLITTLVSVATVTALLYAITTGLLPPNAFR